MYIFMYVTVKPRCSLFDQIDFLQMFFSSYVLLDLWLQLGNLVSEFMAETQMRNTKQEIGFVHHCIVYRLVKC